MTAGMAEVIAAHDGYMCWTDNSEVYIACASPVCDWEAETSDPASSHHAHVAAELAKAGYGDVREAFGVAADELARLSYVKPGERGRDEYERMLAIRRGDTDKWLRERVEPQHG